MATKFAPPPLTFTPAPAPNIRVAYIAGLATIAANEAAAKLPYGECDKTLDELAVNDRGFTPEFQRLLEAVDESRRVTELNEIGYYAARERYDALLDGTPAPKLIDHIEVYAGLNYAGKPIVRKSADTLSVAGARGAVSAYGRRIEPGTEGEENLVLWLRAARQVVAVDKWRQRQEQRAASKAKAFAEAGSGLSEAARLSDEASDRHAECLDRLLNHPASNTAELDEQCRLNDAEGYEAEGILLASARRLLAGALA